MNFNDFSDESSEIHTIIHAGTGLNNTRKIDRQTVESHLRDLVHRGNDPPVTLKFIYGEKKAGFRPTGSLFTLTIRPSNVLNQDEVLVDTTLVRDQLLSGSQTRLIDEEVA